MLRLSSEVYNAGWLDIVFNNRNKNYGAYVLRGESGSTLTKSFFITAPLFIMLFVGPFIYGKLNPVKYEKVYTVTPKEEIFKMPDVIKQKEEPVKQTLPKAEKVKMTQFTASPRVKEMPDNVEIPTIKELENTVVGPVNQEGPATVTNALPSSPDTNGAGVVNTPAEDNTIYAGAIVEFYPEFEGGMKAWIKYMERNLKYPYRAQEEGIQGKVYVSFVVEKDGSITDVAVLKGLGFGMDEEALRVIKKSPRWKPGKQGNSAVRVRYNMPINFSLQ